MSKLEFQLYLHKVSCVTLQNGEDGSVSLHISRDFKDVQIVNAYKLRHLAIFVICYSQNVQLLIPIIQYVKRRLSWK